MKEQALNNKNNMLVKFIRKLIPIVGTVILLLWLSYFFACLYKIKSVSFTHENIIIAGLRKLLDISGGYLSIHFNIFDDEYYVEDFPGITLILEIIFIILLEPI